MYLILYHFISKFCKIYYVLPFKMSNRGESAKHGRRKIALLGFHATCCAHIIK